MSGANFFQIRIVARLNCVDQVGISGGFLGLVNVFLLGGLFGIICMFLIRLACV